MAYTAEQWRAMNQQDLMAAISRVTSVAELQQAIDAGINSQQQQAALDRIAHLETRAETGTAKLQARIAIAVSLVALLVAIATWLGWRPI